MPEPDEYLPGVDARTDEIENDPFDGWDAPDEGSWEDEPDSYHSQGGYSSGPADDADPGLPPGEILQRYPGRGSYHIDALSPEYGCPGDSVTIIGSGFSPWVEAVRFAGPGGSSIAVEPDSQSSTQIVVTVPEGTVTGPIGLTIPDTGIGWSNQELLAKLGVASADSSSSSEPPPLLLPKLPKSGNHPEFTAGGATIQSFTVNGVTDDLCVEAGSDVEISWVVEPPSAQVTITWQGSQVFGGVQPAGTAIWPAGMTEGTLSATLRADSGLCGEATRSITVQVEGPLPVLAIEGVEITQGIQRFWRSDGVADNSIPVVEGKDTIVRVYVSSDRGGYGNDQAEITGTLAFGTPPVELLPINQAADGTSDPFVTVASLDTTRRSETDYSLNFRIPAAQSSGYADLETEVFAPGFHAGTPSASATVSVTWMPAQAVPVRIRRIRDPSGEVVSVGDALTTVERAFRYLPSPPTDIDVVGGTFDLGSNSEWYYGSYESGTGMWWLSQLIARNHEWHEHLQGPTIWIGMTYSFTQGMMAWPYTKTCIAPRMGASGQPDLDTKAAHELSHCIGLGHVVTDQGEWCDNGVVLRCESLPNDGLLPDVPFDPVDNTTVSDSAGVWDLMTYKDTRWTSEQHWKLLHIFTFNW